MILRLALDHNEQPSGVIMDSRAPQPTPESGDRAGFDGHKRRKGSRVHAAVDALGHLLAVHVTPCERTRPGTSCSIGTSSPVRDR